MITDSYKVIGVMSGTSLDGVDMVYVELTKNAKWGYRIFNSETISYSKSWKHELSSLTSRKDFDDINERYTIHLAELITKFIEKHNIRDVDFVSSHGHTALHRPKEGVTLQIGNLPQLSTLTGLKVVCDFRVDDVKLGGEGAPLVPIGDHLLFSGYDFCLNLGGFANVSTVINNERIAYDICPLNIVLNHYVWNFNKEFDDQGKISSSGSVNESLLKEFNSLEFYLKEYPKSLGLEWVQEIIFPLAESYQLKIEDILRTFVEHFAFQISQAIKAVPETTVLVTGGGAYNSFLMGRIKELSLASYVVPENDLVEYKEAVVFALLGVLKIRNEINCLKSVTGASEDHSSGKIFQY